MEITKSGLFSIHLLKFMFLSDLKLIKFFNYRPATGGAQNDFMAQLLQNYQ